MNMEDEYLVKSTYVFAKLLKGSAIKENIDTVLMGFIKVEAVKLLVNAFLALWELYFNELDTYAEMKGLNTQDIIDNVCLNSHIGSDYNNLNFSYGGYCIPKDTK